MNMKQTTLALLLGSTSATWTPNTMCNFDYDFGYSTWDSLGITEKIEEVTKKPTDIWTSVYDKIPIKSEDCKS